MTVIANGKIHHGYRITIPHEVVQFYDIDENTIVEWIIDENDELKLNFKNKKNFKKFIGTFCFDEDTNGLNLKRSLYN